MTPLAVILTCIGAQALVVAVGALLSGRAVVPHWLVLLMAGLCAANWTVAVTSESTGLRWFAGACAGVTAGWLVWAALWRRPCS